MRTLSLLLKNAMASQANHAAENCAICLEDKSVDQIFLVAGCQHRYCDSCLSKHVEFKLLQGTLPRCPHENCKSELNLDSCKKLLTPELFEIMSQRVKEASIPAAEKIYCPFPRCSALLSKPELRGSMKNSNIFIEVAGGRKCPRCSGVFCVKCRVPWHYKMSCVEYNVRNSYHCNEEKKLKGLADENRWRQCPKCSHMVSLGGGCYHISCRCGHEFCYTCGAPWKNKKASCTCRIWDEHNIVYDGRNRRQGR